MTATPLTTSDPSVAVWCERHFGLREVYVERELTGGMFARPLLLCTERGWFVYRTHRFRANHQAFRFQAELVAAAAVIGLAPRILPTLNGEPCAIDPTGEGVVALHAYAEGWQYDWESWRETLDESPSFIASLGAAVAALHNALLACHPAGDPALSCDLPPIQFIRLGEIWTSWERDLDRLASSPDVECGASRNALLSRKRFLAECWRELEERSAEVRLIAMQPVHGDISPVNLVWREGGPPVFIDWDASHVGHRLYDALGDVLHRPPGSRPEANRLCLDHLRSYLRGYSNAIDRPLGPTELSMIPAFTLARQLEDLRQRLAVLPTLPVSLDAQYARLIEMRCDMLSQILATTNQAWLAVYPNP